jgi:hypothetical protein
METDEEKDKDLQDFLVNCLIDQNFSQFVKKVERSLVDIIGNELKDL